MRRAAHIFAIGLMGAALGLAAGVEFVDAKAVEALKADRVPDTSLLIQHLGRGKLVVNGKEWDAKKYCNPQSIANPEQIELYQLNDKRPAAVVLCTGTADGEENVVTLFPSKGWPKSRRVKPKSSKSRISDDVLRATIVALRR